MRLLVLRLIACLAAVSACDISTLSSAALNTDCAIMVAFFTGAIVQTNFSYLPMRCARLGACLYSRHPATVAFLNDASCCNDQGIPFDLPPLNGSDAMVQMARAMGARAVKDAIEAMECPVLENFASERPDVDRMAQYMWGEAFSYLPSNWRDLFSRSRESWARLRDLIPSRCFPQGEILLQTHPRATAQFATLLVYSFVMVASLGLFYARRHLTPIRQRGVVVATIQTVVALVGSWILQSSEIFGFTSTCGANTALHVLITPLMFLSQASRAFQLYAKYSFEKIKVRLANRMDLMSECWQFKLVKWYTRPKYVCLALALFSTPNVVAFVSLMVYYAPQSTQNYVDSSVCGVWRPTPEWKEQVRAQLWTAVPEFVVDALTCTPCTFLFDTVEVNVASVLIWMHVVTIVCMTLPLLLDRKKFSVCAGKPSWGRASPLRDSSLRQCHSTKTCTIDFVTQRVESTGSSCPSK